MNINSKVLLYGLYYLLSKTSIPAIISHFQKFVRSLTPHTKKDHKWSVVEWKLQVEKFQQVGIKTKFKYQCTTQENKKETFGKKSAVNLEELGEGQCYSPGPVKVD